MSMLCDSITSHSQDEWSYAGQLTSEYPAERRLPEAADVTDMNDRIGRSQRDDPTSEKRSYAEVQLVRKCGAALITTPRS